MSDGYFRVKKGFTVVQNTVTRDKNLSLKAKGLYMLIQSYITGPDKQWLKSDFLTMVSEGKCAFQSAWEELKEAGYIKMHVRVMGRSFSTEFELLDEPKSGAHTFYYNGNGEVTRTVESNRKNQLKA